MLLYLDEVSEAHKLSNIHNLWKNMFKNITACHSLDTTLTLKMYRCQLKNVNKPFLNITKNFTICIALNLKFTTGSFLCPLCIFILFTPFSVKTEN